MPQRARECRVFEVYYGCDTEGCDGEMRPTGRGMELPNGVRLEHQCYKCRATVLLDSPHPGMMNIGVGYPIPAELQKMLDETPAPGKKLITN